MNTDRWNRIKEIFHAALAHEPGERGSFLDEVCRSDPNLRGEVEVLLSSYDDSDRFMELPSGAGLLSNGRDGELSQTRIGQYLIQEAISSGGMGTVYKALQENPRRAVAVKVMREGIASKSALRRFEYESQILARLTHPNIAQVIEAGTHPERGGDKTGGLPYFVMEYIPEAKSVTEYSREKGLSLSERLALFLQICGAVHHGHQKGIIHRDLKPSNILVNASGQVKIIDFGVARATDSDLALTTAQTDVGKLIGTVQYMSPEQCTADPNDIDTRSDVYALGVVLYELLCEELPYDVRKAAVFEATRVIRERDPRKPSTAKRALKGDVETIVLKALEKDRERRYQTVAALGTDIRRFLDGDVILAKPAGPATRTLKRIKRNPVWSTAAFMALSSLVIFMGYVLFVSNPQLKRERDAAEREKQKAQAAEGKAVEALNDTKREANVNRAINDYLKDMLSSPNPVIDGREVRVVEVLDKAAAEIDEAFIDQPEIEVALRQTIGWTYFSLGQLDDAEPQLRQALEISRRAYGEEYILSLRLIVDLAHVLYQTGQLSEAEAMLRRSTGIMDRLWGCDDPDTLQSMSMLGTILQAKGDLDEAESLLLRTLELQRRVQGEDHKDTMYTRNMLATTLGKQERYAEAEAIYRDLLEVQLRKLGKENWATLNSMAGLANTLCMQDKLTKCEEVSRRVMEGRSRVMGEDHPITFQSMGNLATVLCRQFRFSDAEALYRKALDGCLQNLGENRPITVGIMDGLARVLSYGGKFAESELLFRKVLRAYEHYLGRENPKALKSMIGLAKALREQEKFIGAFSLVEEVLEIQRRTLAEDDPDVLYTKEQLGLLLLAQERFFEAELLFREIMEIDGRDLDEGNPELLDAAMGLGRSLTGQLKLSEAEPLLRQILMTARAHFSEGHLGIPTICYRYGECLLKMKQYERAEKHLLKGHEGFLSIYGENHKNTWLARGTLVELYDSWDKPEKASAWRGKRIQQ